MEQCLAPRTGGRGKRAKISGLWKRQVENFSLLNPTWHVKE